MDLCTLISNLFLGIVSGIVSSLIVTAFYRKIDQEKDRQQYFFSLRLYISQLLKIKYNDIKTLDSFLSINEFPVVFKWIKLNYEEAENVKKIYDICTLIESTVTDYKLEEMDLIEKSLDQQEIESTLYVKYITKLLNYLTDLRMMHILINSLGNKGKMKIYKSLITNFDNE